mmetsp:Transcript_78620/g.206366  ORF Transcript_78620/g.206366 Transcript_78620/m.206366 type:complete len:275 (-) Transcript_78620:30-854(-)
MLVRMPASSGIVIGITTPPEFIRKTKSCASICAPSLEPLREPPVDTSAHLLTLPGRTWSLGTGTAPMPRRILRWSADSVPPCLPDPSTAFAVTSGVRTRGRPQPPERVDAATSLTPLPGLAKSPGPGLVATAAALFTAPGDAVAEANEVVGIVMDVVVAQAFVGDRVIATDARDDETATGTAVVIAFHVVAVTAKVVAVHDEAGAAATDAGARGTCAGRPGSESRKIDGLHRKVTALSCSKNSRRRVGAPSSTSVRLSAMATVLGRAARGAWVR